MTFDSYLEALDLRAMHIVLSITGVVLSTHLMQLAWHNPEECGLATRIVRRLNLGLVAFAMLWGLNYASERDWQPWPPLLLLLVAVNVMMGMRVAAIYAIRHRRASLRTLYRVEHRLPQRRASN